MTLLDRPITESFAMTFAPVHDPSLPVAFRPFVSADEWAQMRAEQADLHARAAEMVTPMATIADADHAICEHLADIARRCKALYPDDDDPQARAFEALLTAVGSDRTSNILATISAAIHCAGPASRAELFDLEQQIEKETNP